MAYGTGRYGQDVYSTAALHPYANVTGKVMWIVQVDWGRDGSFGQAVEPQNIRRLSFSRGRSERLRADGLGQRQPENEVFEIEISDNAGRYDAFNVDGPLYPFLGAPGLGLRVYLVSTTRKSAAEPVFCGLLERVDYDSGRGAATLRGCGLSKLLEMGTAQQVFSPCQSGSLGAWDDWFSPGIPTVAPVNYWKGKPEGLYLNECVRLVLERAGWTRGFYAEPAVANDDQPDFFFMDGGTAWAQLKEIADAFCARLFFGRDGRLLVLSRNDLSGMGTLAGTGLEALRQPGLARESGIDSLRNVIEVNVRSRSVALFVNPPPVADYAAAWMNAGPVAVPPLSSVVMDVEYRHDGAAVQGSLIRANTDNPAESIAYAVWSNPDKSGKDMGPWLGTNEADFTALWEQHGFNAHGNIYVPYGDNQQRTRVQFTNRSASLTAYFFNTQVQIIPILEAGQAGIVTCSDSASVGLNGRRVMNINSPWIQDALMAANIGRAYCAALSGRERAAPVALHYLWSGEMLYQNLSALDVGVYVDFGAGGGSAALANGGLTDRWLIVGQQLTWLGAEGQSALVKLTFEKALDDAAVLLSGLRLWLDASRLRLADGAALAVWPDASGYLNHAVQANIYSQPVYRAAVAGLAGRPAVEFDNVDDYLALTGIITTTSNTYFIVFGLNPGGATDVMLLADTALSYTYEQKAGDWMQKASAVVSGVTTTPGLYYLRSCVSDAVNVMRHANGAALTVKARTAVDARFRYVGLPGYICNAAIAEVIVYDRALSDAERMAIEAYLMAKYGL